MTVIREEFGKVDSRDVHRYTLTNKSNLVASDSKNSLFGEGV